jgi:hypothetical protein
MLEIQARASKGKQMQARQSRASKFKQIQARQAVFTAFIEHERTPTRGHIPRKKRLVRWLAREG